MCVCGKVCEVKRACESTHCASKYTLQSQYTLHKYLLRRGEGEERMPENGDGDAAALRATVESLLLRVMSCVSPTPPSCPPPPSSCGAALGVEIDATPADAPPGDILVRAVGGLCERDCVVG